MCSHTVASGFNSLAAECCYGLRPTRARRCGCERSSFTELLNWGMERWLSVRGQCDTGHQCSLYLLGESDKKAGLSSKGSGTVQEGRRCIC